MKSFIQKCWLYFSRRLPVGMKGKARVSRLFLGNLLDSKDIVVHDLQGFSFVVPSLRETIAFHLLIDGIYEPKTMCVLADCLREGSVFVDVGANIGVFSVPLSRKVGSSGRVLAVEASPAILPYLNGNVKRNDCLNVDVAAFAAHETEGVMPFFEAPPTSFGMGSLSPQFVDSVVNVRTRTLDGWLAEMKPRRVDAIKVDVEGLEASVFKGASKLLKAKNAPLIVFEFDETRVAGGRPDEAQHCLMEYGYRLWRISDYRKHRKSLTAPLQKGFEMLVASKEGTRHAH